jgi:dipeptidase E
MMRKLILFSEPIDQIIKSITPYLFKSSRLKVAYMPSDGANLSEKHNKIWQDIIESHDCEYVLINNSFEGNLAEDEKAKMSECDVLIITGGNTFTLLRNIKRNGMIENIRDFYRKEGSVVCGFSAGAMILTPTIRLSGIGEEGDVNSVGLKDLKGLGLVDFEVCPHYEEKMNLTINRYCATTENSVIRMRNEDYIVVELSRGEIEIREFSIHPRNIEGRVISSHSSRYE